MSFLMSFSFIMIFFLIGGGKGYFELIWNVLNIYSVFECIKYIFDIYLLIRYIIDI